MIVCKFGGRRNIPIWNWLTKILLSIFHNSRNEQHIPLDIHKWTTLHVRTSRRITRLVNRGLSCTHDDMICSNITTELQSMPFDK